MCGICGYRSSQKEVPLEAMIRSLSHRGPDGQGEFRVQKSGIGLGHRRLSIIDLATGGQPMSTADGSLTITFNGEIYNYRELKEDLKKQGAAFRTRSDTEVLLESYRRHGTDMLAGLNGDFAFVLYDKNRDLLFGARDRLGVKPFYYHQGPGLFVFASEIKAILRTGLVRPRVDPAAADLFFAHRYVAGKQTIYREISKLGPGEAFTQTGQDRPVFWNYWRPPQNERKVPFEEALLEYERLLEDSIRCRLVSDVPLGVFLSGGLDSTMIAAGMGRLGQKPLRTFTVGFGESIDETEEAARTAAFLGADHRSVLLPESSFADPGAVLRQMDEPYGDSILLPLDLLSRHTAQSVKTVLTGEGADEGLMGYIHQETFSHLAGGFRSPLGRLLAGTSGALKRIPCSFLSLFFNYPASFGPPERERLALVLSEAASPGRLFERLSCLFTREERERLYGPRLEDAARESEERFFAPLRRRLDQSPDPLREIMLRDLTVWLPDNILNKLDRMTMAHGLEGRVPYLDHRLIEWAASLPSSFKIRGGRGKFLLRELARRRLRIPGRKAHKKAAFFVPLSGGFRNVFLEEARRWLDPGRIDTAVLDPGAVAVILKRSERAGSLLADKQTMALVLFQVWANTCRPEWN